MALGGVLGLCLAHQLMFATLAEDAFISFRYAMNLAEGHGLVFNPGDRVEGYSNFLWVVLIAFPRALFGADIVVVARVLGIACALAGVLLAYVLAKRINGDPGPGMLAATITAASSSFAAYGPSGLETPLFTLLVLAAVLAVQAEWMFSAGILVALATMTRPDGAVIATMIGLWLVVRAIRDRREWRAPALFVVGALVLAAPWTVWRMAYYGYLMPNALAAKSGMALDAQLRAGWDYLVGFAGAAAAVLVVVPLAVYVLMARRDQIAPRARGTVWLLLVLTGVYIAFFTVTGGDWMPAWRFFAPAMPLLAVIVATSWTLTQAGEPDRRVPVAGRIAPGLAAAVCLFLLLGSVYGGRMKPLIDTWRTQVDELSRIGAWTNRTLPDGTVMATFAYGALSYEAGPKLTVIDLLGLTDEHIARRGRRAAEAMIGHAAHDYPYVVTVARPDVVFTDGTGFSRSPVCHHKPELAGHYRPVVFQVTGRALWAPLFVRTERADTVLPKLDADPEFTLVPCP